MIGLLLETYTLTIFVNYQTKKLYSFNPSEVETTLDFFTKKVFGRKKGNKYFFLFSDHRRLLVLERAFDTLLQENKLKFIKNYQDADDFTEHCDLLDAFVRYCWEENFCHSVNIDTWEIIIQQDFLVNVSEKNYKLFEKNIHILTSDCILDVKNYILPEGKPHETWEDDTWNWKDNT